MGGEFDTRAHDRRVQQIGGWLSLTDRMPEPVDRPGPTETGSEALEGTAEEANHFPGYRT